MWEKIRKLQHVTKVQSHEMLVLTNVRIKPSNERNKIRVLSNMTKVPQNMMLVLPNVTMKPSNVSKIRELQNETTVQLHVMLILPIWQWNIKCEKKKIKVSSNATKLWSNLILVLLNVIMEPSNMTKNNNNK